MKIKSTVSLLTVLNRSSALRGVLFLGTMRDNKYSVVCPNHPSEGFEMCREGVKFGDDAIVFKWNAIAYSIQKVEDGFELSSGNPTIVELVK